MHLRVCGEVPGELGHQAYAGGGERVADGDRAAPRVDPWVVVWDAEDSSSDIALRAAYSLARALAVRERRVDRESVTAIAEIDRSARAIERQIGYLAEIRKWADTVKGHGEKIAERSARMADELRRDVERLDAQVAGMRTAAQPAG